MNEFNNQNGYNNIQAGAPKPGAGLGIASMVLGIVALCISCCFYYVSIPLAIIGAILGAVGIAKNSGKGMAIAGLVCSIISLVPGIIMAVTGAAIVDSIKSSMGM